MPTTDTPLEQLAAMESVELCARLSRLLRVNNGTTALSSEESTSSVRSELRAALDAVVAHYGEGSQASSASTSKSSLSGVDDMLLMALQRLLLTTLRDHDCGTQERAFTALGLLLLRCQCRLTPARLIEVLQTCVVYLPTPTAASSSSTTPDTLASSDGQRSPEELRLLVLRALEVLLSAPVAASAVQRLTASQDDHVHFVAYVVSCLLQLAERERHRGLAMLAIHVLSLLLLDCGDSVDAATDSRVLRQFFPGVSVGLWRTMSAPQQSSRVVVAALECLSAMIARCLGDSLTDSPSTSAPFSVERLRELQQSAATTTPMLLSPEHTGDPWLVQSSEKIDLLLSQLLASTTIRQQTTWRVRRALVDLCQVVVSQCRQSLHASFFRCFEELMVLQNHAIDEISRAARVALQELHDQLPLSEWLVLEPQVGERFLMRLSALALSCGTDHESSSVYLLQVLSGYLQFQRQRLRSVLDDAMPSIYRQLAHIVAFEALDVDLLRHEQLLVQPQSQDDDHDDHRDQQISAMLPYFRKLFRHFHDESSVAVAMRLLRDIGAIATPAAVVDAAFTLLQQQQQQQQQPDADDGDAATSSDSRESVLVVLSETLRAHVGTATTQDNVHLVGRVLDDLLTLPLWNSVYARDKNAVALLVECVGVCVELAGATFEDFLIFALYPLVEKLGDPAVQVARAALTTLHKIALLCGFQGDLHALFQGNMDYFVDALCVRLQHVDAFPQSPQVVQALLQHASVASLPLMDEITRALLRAVDLNQHEQLLTTALLRSLQLLLQSFAKREQDQEAGEKEEEGTEEEISPLTRFLLEMRAMTEPLSSETTESSAEKRPDATTVSVKAAMPLEFGEYANGTRDKDDQSQEDQDDQDEQDDDAEPPPLPFQSQTVEILDRCSYFVADSDPTACCLVLRTIQQGVQYLRPRRRQLLPLVHRLWPSLLHRLTATNRPILTATMELLATLALCAGDFIGDRFVETVWPSMERQLKTIAENARDDTRGGKPSLTRAMLLLSVADESGASSRTSMTTVASTTTTTTTRTTQETKLLAATLRCLRVVCQRAVTVSSLVPQILTTCVRFLDATAFPAAIVSLTEELLLTLATLNGDEVFVALASLAEWQPPRPPSSSMRFPAYDVDVATRQHKNGSAQAQAQALAWQIHCQASAMRVLDTLMTSSV